MRDRVTKLVNMRQREDAVTRRVDRSSRFGNPYVLEEAGGEHTRAESIEKYEEWFDQRLDDPVNGTEFKRALTDLRGEVLGCWCVDGVIEGSPERPFVCHGEVLLAWFHGEATVQCYLDEFG
jgi:hypothetical protein